MVASCGQLVEPRGGSGRSIIADGLVRSGRTGRFLYNQGWPGAI